MFNNRNHTVFALMFMILTQSFCPSPTLAEDTHENSGGFFSRHPKARKIGKACLLGAATGGIFGAVAGGSMIGHAVGGAALKGGWQ
ncbi:MAG TPA: hypothetical protein V6C72_17910, partial [Chroococcales cyanobacterium]